MGLVQLLFSVLVTGAGLAASSALTEFSKSAGKGVFEKLKERLEKRHEVKSLPLLEKAKENSAYEAAVKEELSKPEILGDADVLDLAEQLRKAIAALPNEETQRYAVDIETIRSGGNLLFEAIEGVKAKRATSEGDMTFKDIKAPPGK